MNSELNCSTAAPVLTRSSFSRTIAHIPRSQLLCLQCSEDILNKSVFCVSEFSWNWSKMLQEALKLNKMYSPE